MTQTTTADSNKQTYVWDPFVRLFHWVLVFAFFTAYIVEEDVMSLHVWAGYTVFALIVSRIIWGLIGTRHARFSDFIYRPSMVLGYLKDIARRHPKRYLGHNPAGGAMIILLMFCLLALTLSGMALYGADQHAGPLASMLAGASHDAEEMLEEVHEFFANFTVLLVVFHVGGVIVESLLHRENLVSAMLTGYKKVS